MHLPCDFSMSSFKQVCNSLSILSARIANFLPYYRAKSGPQMHLLAWICGAILKKNHSNSLNYGIKSGARCSHHRTHGATNGVTKAWVFRQSQSVRAPRVSSASVLCPNTVSADKGMSLSDEGMGTFLQ